jgi:hypothetical protein
MTTKQIVKLCALVVGGITVVVLFSTHPVISVLIAVAGTVFYLVDSGKVNV